MPAFDPILIEVVKNELAAVTEEMALAVWKTGRSTMLKAGDFTTAISDATGRMFGHGYAGALGLTFLGELMQFVLNKHGGKLEPGDVIVGNDPYAGAMHMPDTTIVMPMYWQEQIVGYLLAYS